MVEEEFTEKWLDHRQYLFATAYDILRNRSDVEDALSRTFKRLLLAFRHGQYKEKGRIKYYFRKSLINTCNTIIKEKSKRKLREFSLDYALQNKDNENVFSDFSLLDILKQEGNFYDQPFDDESLTLIKKIRKKYRTAFLLYILHGLNYKEIAKHLKIPIGTVMSRIFRAKKELRMHAKLHEILK